MKPSSLISGLALPLLFVSTLQAASVSYTAANFAGNGSNTSILENTGTLVTAVNFSTSPIRSGPFSATNPDPNVTINGVTFTPTQGTNALGLIGANYTVNSSGLDVDRDSNVSWADAPALDGLVYDVIRTDDNGKGMVFTLTNLIPNQEYRTQFIFSASDAARRLYLTSQADADLAGNTNILSYGTGAASALGAGLLGGTFTADAATQTFNFFNTNAPAQRVSLAGFTLHAIPEPGILPLGLTALLPLLRRHRRS